MFFCKECGYESSKWMGQCPACREWNSFVEEPVVSEKKSPAAAMRAPGRGAAPVRLADISLEEQDRTKTGFGELDRVLGDGIVKGSLVLVGGDPGIGKSTLLLQVCRNLAAGGKARPLYFRRGVFKADQNACRAGSVHIAGRTALPLRDESGCHRRIPWRP